MRNHYHLHPVLLFGWATLSLSCILLACKKSEKDIAPLTATDELFFKETTDADPVVQRIAAALKCQNKEEKFVSKLSKDEGLPVWNKAMIQTIANDTVVAIPLVLKDTRYVNSYMLYKLKKQGSIAFVVKGRQPYFFSALTNQSLDAAKISRQLMALNNRVFGDTLFTIIDGKILNRSSGKQLITFKPPSTNLTVGTHISPSVGGNDQTANRVVTFCYWENSGDDEGNDGDGGETGSGGGGQPFLPAVRVPVWVCDLWITVDPPLPPGTPTIPQTPIGGGGGVSGGNNPVTPVPPLNNYSCPSYYTQQQCAEITMPAVMPEIPQSVALEQEAGLSDRDPNLIWWDENVSDPNTIYYQQNKPTFDNMYKNYPKNDNGTDDMSAEKVFEMVGGEPLALYKADPLRNGNACALRVSRALLYSGVSIPYIPNHTFKGADGKYYFLGAQKLYNWLTKTFGSPDIHKTAKDGSPNGTNFKKQLIGIQNKGIYIMKPTSPKDFKASGHTTLWGGYDCIGGHNYFAAASDVYIWKLN